MPSRKIQTNCLPLIQSKSRFNLRIEDLRIEALFLGILERLIFLHLRIL